MTRKDYKTIGTRMKRRQNQPGGKSTWKKVVLITALVLVIFTGLFAFFLYDFFFNDGTPQFEKLRLISGLKNNKKDALPFTKLNILIIGYDSEVNGRPRSDTLMLASFDIEEKAVGIVSIPRDTRVLVPGHELHSKVNSAFAEGGSAKAVETISAFLDIPIHYYIATDFDGFAQMIDTLGGVRVNVKEDMNYQDVAGGLNINLKKGEQVLNGQEAIGFVRYRDDITADLGRINRQQEFINQAINQFLSPELLIKFPTLIGQFQSSVKTDMSVKDLANLAKLVKDIDRSNIKTATIPGTTDYLHGVSYFLHDPEGTEKLVHDLIASKEYVANSKIRIGVYNGNGTFGMAGSVRDMLKLHGYNIVKIANANRYNYEKTQVFYTAELTKEIEDLAQIFDGEAKPFTESDYGTNESLLTQFDAMVIIGKDYTG